MAVLHDSFQANVLGLMVTPSSQFKKKMCIGVCLHVCLCTLCLRKTKEGVRSPGPGATLWMGVNCPVGTGNRTQAFGRAFSAPNP